MMHELDAQHPQDDNSDAAKPRVSRAKKKPAASHSENAASTVDRKLRGMVDAIARSQLIIELSMEGTIQDANAIALNTLGYSLEEIKGQHHSMFVDHRTGRPRNIGCSGKS